MPIYLSRTFGTLRTDVKMGFTIILDQRTLQLDERAWLLRAVLEEEASAQCGPRLRATYSPRENPYLTTDVRGVIRTSRLIFGMFRRRLVSVLNVADVPPCFCFCHIWFAWHPRYNDERP